MRDLKNNLGAAESVRPAIHAATVTGEVVDLSGFNSAMVLVQSGAIAGDGLFVATMQHSDTTTSGDFADVTAADLVGAFAEAMTANTIERVGYIGGKRYLRVVLTKTSGTSIAAGAAIILGNPASRPVA